jgi:putative ABC transport system permease protein
MNFVEIIRLAAGNITLHRFRSGLTLLGVILGISAVITMMAITEGASQEVAEQIQMLGLDNIWLRSRRPPETPRSEPPSSPHNRVIYTYGLTLRDIQHLKTAVPFIKQIALLRDLRKDVWNKSKKTGFQALATTPDYLWIINSDIARGRFITDHDQKGLKRVCVLGAEAAHGLFPYENPLGNHIRIGDQYFRVVGVMQDRRIATKGLFQMRDLNRDIYVPFETFLQRFGPVSLRFGEGTREGVRLEVDEALLEIEDQTDIIAAAELIREILSNRHPQRDFELIVPLELLRQKQQTQRTFSLVMILIAAISLLVGGIGIMNIMLATVRERTREIGIRRALGACQHDIMY